MPFDCRSVGFNESAVSVIKGRPEIMDCIADNSGRVLRDRCPKGAAFPSLRVWLGAHGLYVRHNVGMDNSFELTDVLFGPI